MEQYVYLSIIFFILIIFFLYLYIVAEKMLQKYQRRLREKYSRQLDPDVDNFVNEIIAGKNIESTTLERYKEICKNRIKREIVEQRMLYYFENVENEFLPRLTEFCKYAGIIKYELKNLKGKNNFKKALAAKRLGEFRNTEATEVLLQEVNTTNVDVKYNILMALAKIGDEDSFVKAFENIDTSEILSERSLIEIVDSFEGDKIKIYKVMINCQNSFIASVFIKSAGNFKNLDLSKDISKYLRSEEKELKIASLKTIGKTGNAKFLDYMIEALQDEAWEVRAVTAGSLGNFANEKILQPLAKALSDSQWNVRFNAASSILRHRNGMDIVAFVFEGKDKFAKDIILSAIQNSHNNKLHEFETSGREDQVALALKIKEYTIERNKEAGV